MAMRLCVFVYRASFCARRSGSSTSSDARMTLPGFSAPGAAWLFALLVPVVVFYFLKLKRPRQVMPSLVLWQQVLRDSRVNSPFQKFKRHLLLFLQIALLALLALAAMQPFLRRQAARAQRLPILIDCSASMAALDRLGGTRRIDEAKQRIRQIIETLPSDENLCLISFGKTARKRTSFTNDKRLLRDTLEQIEVEDVASDLEDAMRLTQALARSEPFDEVILFSDGNFPVRTNFELSFNVNYQRLPAAGPNFGITACNARRGVDGQWEIFVQVESSAEAEGGGVVELTLNGTRVASERFSLGKAGSQRMTFSGGGDTAGLVQVRLVPDEFDSLSSDNFAWLDLPKARLVSVYTPESMSAYRHALQAMTGVDLSPPSTPSAYDLVITDRSEDLEMKAPLCCYVGLVPSDLEKLVKIEEASVQPVDWRHDSSYLQHVELTDVVATADPHSLPGVQPGDYTNAGYEILVDGPHGPLALEKREGARTSIYLLFHTDRSTLPYRVGFPVFVTNLVQAAMKGSRLAEANAVRTGALPPLRLEPNRTYEITGPDGAHRSEASDGQGILSGIPALRAGEYKVSEGGSVRARLGASLLSPAETTLKSADQIQFNEQLAVAASNVALKTDRALWYPLACVAFGLLLVEWWFYQRKPGK